MKKSRNRNGVKTSDGFIKVGTSLHERHIEAIERIISSREGMRRGLTKRDVLYQIISQYFNEDRDDATDVILGQMKLDIEREFRAIKQRQHALIEMIALLVRIYLGHAPVVPDDRKEAFRARSLQRFGKYSEEVVKMLSKRSDFFETVSAEAIAEAFEQLASSKS